MATGDLNLHDDGGVPSFDPLMRLRADMKTAARNLGRGKVTQLVDMYYQVQEIRKITANQRREAEESNRPNALVDWMSKNWVTFEGDIKRAMFEFSDNYRVGQWMMSIVGIGPVIAAGLLAQLHPLPNTVGHWWRFAGLDPSQNWLGKVKGKQAVDAALESTGGDLDAAALAVAKVIGTRPETLKRLASTKPNGDEIRMTQATLARAAARRPWNANLKVLCWKMGDSFVKFKNHPQQSYGTVYDLRKDYEVRKNERGDYADQAARSLAERNFGEDTEARKWYEQGKLPPARIHLRCMRYAEKMFLSHAHRVMWEDLRPGQPIPRPYGLEKVTGDHRHYVEAPHWDPKDPWAKFPGRSLAELGD